MLDRQIQIIADLLFFLHHLDQIVVDFFRIAVKDPDPADPVNPAKLLQKTVQGLLSIKIFSIQCGFLGHQDQLFYSLVGQILCFLKKPLHGNAPEISPELWYDAVGAVFVTALRNLQIGIMPSCGNDPVGICKRQRVKVVCSHMSVSFQRFPYRLYDLCISRGAKNGVYLRNLI